MKIPSESYESEMLANWLDIYKYRFSAIRNESDKQSWFMWKKRYKQWVRKWIPDYCILLKNKQLLFIELKRQKKVLKTGKLWASPSKISPEQLEWVKELNEIPNINAENCYWAKEAIELIIHLEAL